MRTREYGWTTQKVFHLLNFVVHGGDDNLCFLLTNDRILCFFSLFASDLLGYTFHFCFDFCAVRAVLFGFHHQVFLMHPKVRFCIGFWRLLISNISYLLILEHYNIFSCTRRSQHHSNQHNNIFICYRVVLVCFFMHLMHPKVRFCIGFDAYSSPIFHACHH